ncbi:N-acetyltransferase family protein [Actinomadura kijaniata]|uniref:GNAT family N-acetyltransferase n=1 Tax=Actinomadura kijaniata TaxID=46161 RepID=UPI003F1A1D0E
MDVEVRRAVPDDADAVARVHVAAWREAYRGVFPDAYLDGLDPRERAATWRGQISDPVRTVLVAVGGARVVGFASFGPPRDADLGGDCAELYAIYLEPGRWGGGAGRALMREVLAGLAPGTRRLVLWVLEGNARAIRFYERHGFVPDGARAVVERGGHPAVQVRYAAPVG